MFAPQHYIIGVLVPHLVIMRSHYVNNFTWTKIWSEYIKNDITFDTPKISRSLPTKQWYLNERHRILNSMFKVGAFYILCSRYLVSEHQVVVTIRQVNWQRESGSKLEGESNISWQRSRTFAGQLPTRAYKQRAFSADCIFVRKLWALFDAVSSRVK